MTLFPKRASFLMAALVLFGVFIGISAPSWAQQEEQSKRLLLERPAPVYPALARTLGLQGIVRMEAVISPDGSVKTLFVKGGNPVLAEAAVNAVRRWKWQRAPQETHEPVEVKFDRK